MRSYILILLAVCGCTAARHTRVVVDYRSDKPLEEVTVEVVNSTGRELPLPPGGLVEQAAHAITRKPGQESSVVNVLCRTLASRLEERSVRIIASGAAAERRLRVRLIGWDVQNDGSVGAVVFVTADYSLLDPEGTLLWKVAQDRLPVRLSGPNLSRHEIERITDTSVHLALASLPRPGVKPSP
jgi:hypothetical protein